MAKKRSKKKSKKNKGIKQVKIRNPFACNPLMRKGGSHEKSKKAKRKNEKMKLKRELKQLPFSFLTTLLRTLLTTNRFDGNVISKSLNRHQILIKG